MKNTKKSDLIKNIVIIIFFIVVAYFLILKFGVSSINLNRQELELEQGDKFNLDYRINPFNLGIYDVVFSSENEDIAKVDNQGNVEAISNGETKIYAKVNNKFDYCIVKVKSEELKDEEKYKDIIYIEDINIDKTAIAIGVTKQDTFKLTYSPSNANEEINYSISNTAICSIDKNTVRGLNPGIAVLTIKTKNVTKTMTIYVIGVDANNKQIKINSKDSITYDKITPSIGEKYISYKLSNNNISVNYGLITPNNLGTTQVSYIVNNEVIKTNTIKVVNKDNIVDIEKRDLVKQDSFTYYDYDIEGSSKYCLNNKDDNCDGEKYITNIIDFDIVDNSYVLLSNYASFNTKPELSIINKIDKEKLSKGVDRTTSEYSSEIIGSKSISILKDNLYLIGGTQLYRTNIKTNSTVYLKDNSNYYTGYDKENNLLFIYDQDNNNVKVYNRENYLNNKETLLYEFALPSNSKGSLKESNHDTTCNNKKSNDCIVTDDELRGITIKGGYLYLLIGRGYDLRINVIDMNGKFIKSINLSSKTGYVNYDMIGRGIKNINGNLYIGISYRENCFTRKHGIYSKDYLCENSNYNLKTSNIIFEIK